MFLVIPDFNTPEKKEEKKLKIKERKIEGKRKRRKIDIEKI